MKKLSLLFLAILLLTIAACATPSSTPAPSVPTAQPLNLDVIPAGEAFAGLLQGNVPFNIEWYTLDSVPSDSGITAETRPDGGINLRVNDVSMPVWKDGNSWVMSDNVNGSIVDFANGNLGAAGFKDGTIAFVRQFDGQWQIGIVQ